MAVEAIVAAVVGVAVLYLVLQPLLASRVPKARRIRAARSGGDAKRRGADGAQGDRVRSGNRQALRRRLRVSQGQVHEPGTRGTASGKGIGGGGRRRGYDRCQGTVSSLRCDLNAVHPSVRISLAPAPPAAHDRKPTPYSAPPAEPDCLWPVPAPAVARRWARTAAFASGAGLGWRPDTDKMA